MSKAIRPAHVYLLCYGFLTNSLQFKSFCSMSSSPAIDQKHQVASLRASTYFCDGFESCSVIPHKPKASFKFHCSYCYTSCIQTFRLKTQRAFVKSRRNFSPYIMRSELIRRGHVTSDPVERIVAEGRATLGHRIIDSPPHGPLGYLRLAPQHPRTPPIVYWLAVSA